MRGRPLGTRQAGKASRQRVLREMREARGRAEVSRQPDGAEGRPQSLQEQMAVLHPALQRSELPTLLARAEDKSPVRKMSIAERIAELQARPKTDQKRERERQIERIANVAGTRCDQGGWAWLRRVALDRAALAIIAYV